MLEQLRGSGRRFAAVSVVAVAVIATAVGVTIWRYEAALSRSAVALDARSDAALTETLSSDFWHEHEAINEYFLAPSPAIFAEVSAQRRQFAATSAVLGATQTPTETRFREQASSGDNAFIAAFTRLAGAARQHVRSQPSRGWARTKPSSCGRWANLITPWRGAPRRPRRPLPPLPVRPAGSG